MSTHGYLLKLAEAESPISEQKSIQQFKTMKIDVWGKYVVSVYNLGRIAHDSGDLLCLICGTADVESLRKEYRIGFYTIRFDGCISLPYRPPIGETIGLCDWNVRLKVVDASTCLNREDGAPAGIIELSGEEGGAEMETYGESCAAKSVADYYAYIEEEVLPRMRKAGLNVKTCLFRKERGEASRGLPEDFSAPELGERDPFNDD